MPGEVKETNCSVRVSMRRAIAKVNGYNLGIMSQTHPDLYLSDISRPFTGYGDIVSSPDLCTSSRSVLRWSQSPIFTWTTRNLCPFMA